MRSNVQGGSPIAYPDPSADRWPVTSARRAPGKQKHISMADAPRLTTTKPGPPDLIAFVLMHMIHQANAMAQRLS